MAFDVGTLSGRIRINTSDVDRAAQRLNRLNQTVQGGARRQQQASKNVEQAATRQTQSTQKVTQSTQQASKATQKYAVDTTDLSKSVQVALGPLSGVASRITALTSIFNRNNVALAATLGLFTAFTVAMQRSITVGAELERQLMGMEAIIDTLGDSVSLTAEEVNAMAQALGRDTLTSANQARQAFQIMLTSGIQTREMLREGALAAQGMASALGRSLPNSARRLARVLTDPAENLNTLRRYGVQFTEQQREQIERMQRTADVAGAQAMVMEELSAFTELATGESQGLSGAIDTLGENFRQAFENAGLYGGAIDTLTNSVNRLSGAVQSVGNNEQIIRRLGSAFEAVANFVTTSLSLIFENIELVTTAATSLFIGLIAGRITAIMLKFGNSVGTAAIKLGLMDRATKRASVSLSILSGVIRTIPFVAVFTVATTMMQAMVFEVETINDTLSETGRRLQQVETRMSRIGGDRSGIERIGQSFRVAESGIEATQARIQELRSELSEVTGDQGRPNRGMEERRDAIMQAIQEERGELDEYRQMLKRVRGDIEDFNRRTREQQETLERFDVSKSFLDDLQSQYSSTRDEIEEFEKQQKDLQALINRVDASKMEDAWGAFEEATGMSREELERLQETMKDENPAQEFARGIQETIDKMDHMAFVARNTSGNIEQSLNRADIRFQARMDTKDLEPQELEAAAEALGAQSANIDDVTSKLAELRLEQERVKRLEDVVGGIEDFRAELDKSVQIEQIRSRFDEQRAVVDQAFDEESEQYRQHYETLAKMEERAINEAKLRQKELVKSAMGNYGQTIQQWQTFFNGVSEGTLNTFEASATGLSMITSEMTSMLDQQHSDYKKWAKAQAVIAGGLAVAKALGSGKNAWESAALAALIGAQVGAQIAKIESAEYAQGGMVRGPGTSRSDSIPAMLSDGEFVMNAQATRRIGSNNLSAMNEGRMPMMQSGGPVRSSSNGGFGMNVKIYNQSSSEVSVEEGQDASGTPELRAYVKDATRENLQRGRHDNDMTSRFAGIRRRGLRR